MTDNNSELLQPSVKDRADRPITPSPSISQAKDTVAPVVDNAVQNVAQVREELTELDSPSSKSTRPKKSRIYKGYKGGSRNDGSMSEYAFTLNLSNEAKARERISVDRVISSAIEAAIKNGQKEVVVFDFGCGDGEMFKQLLEDINPSRAMQLVKKNPDLQVKLIGLTDLDYEVEIPGFKKLPTAQELVTGRDLPSPKNATPNISAHIDYYAITAKQTLEDYFNSKGITSIDVAFAVQSLPYLPLGKAETGKEGEERERAGGNFEATLETIIDRLRSPGGVFLAAPYASQIPGSYETNTAYDYMVEMLHFSSKGESKKPSLQATLRDKGGRFTDPARDVRQEVEFLLAAFEKYKGLGVLSEEEINEEINDLLPATTRGWNMLARQQPKAEQLGTNRDALATLANAVLGNAEHALGQKRREILAKQKKETLERLKKAHENDADMLVEGSRITVRKK